MTAAVVALAGRFGRYGYRRITDLLQMAGWQVNAKRAQRIWRAGRLKVSSKQPKRGRLWLTEGCCIRLRPEHRNYVWACDVVSERTHDGRKLRLLTVVDEYMRECLGHPRAAKDHEPRCTLRALRTLPRARYPEAHPL